MCSSDLEGVARVKVRRRRSVDIAGSRVKLHLGAVRGDAPLTEVGARVQTAVRSAFMTHLDRTILVEVAIEGLR